VFFEMRNVLEEDNFMIERDVIEEHQMLMQLAHVANMWHDRNAKLFGHQADGEKFAYAREASAIRLDEIHASVAKEVLE